MTRLVLTVVGEDRAGLVNALADTIAAHGGNWEQSELAELAEVFAGIVLVQVAPDRVDGLVAALDELEGLLRVTVQSGSAADEDTGNHLRFTVLGNDRPGIVRDVTAAIHGHSLSIDRLQSRTFDAPMAGGTLFEATVDVQLPADADASGLLTALEQLAGEIQVDVVE